MKTIKIYLAIASLFLMGISKTMADNHIWTGTVNNNWTLAANWGGTAPVANDDITIPGGLTNYPVITTNIPAVHNLLINSTGIGAYLTVNTGGALNVTGTVTINSNGTLNLTNGASTINSIACAGSLFVYGGTLIFTYNIDINSGGTFLQSGGSISDVGTNPNNHFHINTGGTGSQTGGTIYVRDFRIRTGAGFTQDETSGTSLIKISHDYSCVGTGSFVSTAGTVEWTGEDNAGAASDIDGINSFFNVLLSGNNKLFAGNSGTLSVAGNWTNNNTSNDPYIIDHTSTIIFNGLGNQIIGGTNITNFNDLILNKTGGNVTLNQDITITGNATFTNGIMNSNSTNSINFLDNATVSGGSNTSYVNGPVIKTGNDAFIFPLGKDGKYAPAGISTPGNKYDIFTAEYFKTPYSDLSVTGALKKVSNVEYWEIARTSGTSAVNVSLYFAPIRFSTVSIFKT